RRAPQHLSHHMVFALTLRSWAEWHQIAAATSGHIGARRGPAFRAGLSNRPVFGPAVPAFDGEGSQTHLVAGQGAANEHRFSACAAPKAGASGNDLIDHE